ncbi:MAG: hypothetical protein KKB31_06710 [Nanoarchaeota archaeon]|nr:hypothetical protein [Nanoarchaeota archaeon]
MEITYFSYYSAPLVPVVETRYDKRVEKKNRKVEPVENIYSINRRKIQLKRLLIIMFEKIKINPSIFTHPQ